MALSNDIDKDTINIEIDEFNYDIDSYTLKVNIDLLFTCDKKEEYYDLEELYYKYEDFESVGCFENIFEETDNKVIMSTYGEWY